jgi:hypothetical protein
MAKYLEEYKFTRKSRCKKELLVPLKYGGIDELF